MAKKKSTENIAGDMPSTNTKIRSYVALFLMLAATLYVVYNMGIIQLVQGDEWLARARSQQVSDSQVAAKRGTIYDANMEPLAVSADVWRLIMSPLALSKVDLDKYENFAKTPNICPKRFAFSG